MVNLRAFALTTVAVVALSSAAVAADLLPPPPAPEPPIVNAELGGWYLRGDVGVGFNQNPTFSTGDNAAGLVGATDVNLLIPRCPSRRCSTSASAIRSTNGSAPT